MPQEAPRGLLLVMIEVDPAYEDEFNRWYNEEHLPERKACPGFLSARRFVAVEGEPKYLALYELESPEVLQGAAYRKIYPPSEWTKQISKHFLRTIRNVYEEVTPTIVEAEAEGGRPAAGGTKAGEEA
jgi:hypothetical protein